MNEGISGSGISGTVPVTNLRGSMCSIGGTCHAVEHRRTINLIWETTQMKVALAVIGASLGVSGALAVFGKWLGTADMQLAAIVFLFGVANLVTGFYFGRTNHQRPGIDLRSSKQRDRVDD